MFHLCICRPSSGAAIQGCEILLQQADRQQANSLAAADARIIATALQDDVEVPGLAIPLRQPALHLLQLLLRVQRPAE